MKIKKIVVMGNDYDKLPERHLKLTIQSDTFSETLK